MQIYKVHAYIISMKFSAVNRRRPSCETPHGPGVKKDSCFRRLTPYLCNVNYCVTVELIVIYFQVE